MNTPETQPEKIVSSPPPIPTTIEKEEPGEDIDFTKEVIKSYKQGLKDAKKDSVTEPSQENKKPPCWYCHFDGCRLCGGTGK